MKEQSTASRLGLKFKHRLTKKRSKKIGLPPGSMVHVGEKKVETARISVIDYDQQKLEVKALKSVEETLPFKKSPTVTWLNIDGLHEVNILETIGEYYSIHPLVLEDILNTDQRPKAEIFDEYIFIVFKMISYNNNHDELDIEQLSLILGPNFVITFQEREGDVFDSIRERIQGGKGRVRKSGPDYLLYALMDVVIDNYFLVLEKLGERIENLEEEVLGNPDQSTVQAIQQMKRELIFLRRSIWPLREVIGTLIRDENPLIKKSTAPFLRDLYDHTIQVVDTIETYREMVSGILDIYLSSLSNRMNEVMKILTIIATLFIPLTFIVGVYGMNFEFMPELKWHWGYPVVWGVMIIISFFMLLYFRRKKWI